MILQNKYRQNPNLFEYAKQHQILKFIFMGENLRHEEFFFKQNKLYNKGQHPLCFHFQSKLNILSIALNFFCKSKIGTHT